MAALPPLPPAFGVLAVARIFGDVGDQTSIEDALAVVYGSKATIEVQADSF